MQYPAPNYAVAVPASKSTGIKIIAAVVVCIGILIIIGAIGIGLGVGLGVGLNKNSDSSSSGSSSSGGSNTAILTAPTVTCTYGGSDTCGCAATTPTFAQTRIINGNTVTTNSWPWAVALFLNNNSTLCGGFLVDYQYVVTAAHCVIGGSPSSMLAYAGLQTLSSRASAQVRTISTVTIHPSYSTTSFINDIAVLKLTSSFTKVPSVGLCCLSSDTSLPVVGQTAVIIGWGRTSTTSSDPSNNLLQALVLVQQPSVCNVASTSSTRFCASYGSTTSCFGDSGSPLMTSVNNLWTCTGLTSAGSDCASSTLYTRVTAYRSFIASAMAK